MASNPIPFPAPRNISPEALPAQADPRRSSSRPICSISLLRPISLAKGRSLHPSSPDEANGTLTLPTRNSRRIPDHRRPGWDIFHNDASGAHDRVIMDGDARKNDRATANPNVLAYDDLLS